MTSIGKSALLLTSAITIPFLASQAAAQVAPTEVNEEAVDEFGMERKTGRFVWSSGEIVGIGPKGSRISLSVNGVRTPPYRQQVYKAVPTSVAQLNQPTISITPVPVEFSQIPGEIHPNINHVTLDYFGGSYTFECNTTSCASLYLLPNFGMRPLGNGYEFEDAFGTRVYVENGYSTITFKDGRQEIYSADGYRANNFGYMLKRTFAGSQGSKWTAVNRAIDVCPTASSTVCANLQEERFGFISNTPTSPLQITDSASGITAVRWIEKTAMEGRPPTGYPDPALPTIPQRTVRYPLGIKLPGESSESIVISYNSHNENSDIHDDIRVDQIIRNGVTVDYTVNAHYPFGKVIEFISPGLEAGGNYQVSDGDYEWQEVEEVGQEVTEECANSGGSSGGGAWDNTPNGSSSQSSFHTNRCSGGGLISGGGGGLNLNRSFQQAPPDEDHPENGSSAGSQIYELTITGLIDGETVSQSHTLRPYSREGAARRRLLYTEDALGRRTTYAYDRFDEVTAVRQPEGNWVGHLHDLRGNVAQTLAYPKTESDLPAGDPLTTAYSYVDDCTNANIAWCNRPLSMTDPMGNVTDYEYNQYGQLTKETAPAPASGEARPTVINEYAMRQAYIKDANGNPTPAGPPISILVKSYSCISSAVCDANTPATDKVVTEYDYGPTTGLNNLLLRGMSVTAANADGQLETRLTCYTYNYFGEQISETLPEGNANLTSCPS